MFNLLKADILKLKYSKSWKISFICIAILFIIYMTSGDSSFIYSGQLYPLGIGVGFSSHNYVDINNPLIGEIIRTAMSYTAFIWLIILVFTVSFFTKEYSENTIRLSVAYGESKFKLYASKAIIIVGYSFLLYYMLTICIFIHSCIVKNFIPNSSDILTLLKLITLNYMVMIVFILIILTLSLIIKNTGAVNTTICMFIFSCPMVYLMVWNTMDKQPFLIKLFLKINPMYYWSTLCAYNFENNIIGQTLIYVSISVIVLITLTYLILKKQEIK